jgi:hypothetical protein
MSLPNEIVIDVTPEDAKNAKIYLCSDCLLGTAVKRQLNTKHVRVGALQIKILNKRYMINGWKKIRGAYGERMEIFPPVVETPFQVVLTKI